MRQLSKGYGANLVANSDDIHSIQVLQHADKVADILKTFVFVTPIHGNDIRINGSL